MVHMLDSCAVTSAMLEPENEYSDAGDDAIASMVRESAPPKPTLIRVMPAALQTSADAMAARAPPYAEFCSPSVSSRMMRREAGAARADADVVEVANCSRRPTNAPAAFART